MGIKHFKAHFPGAAGHGTAARGGRPWKENELTYQLLEEAIKELSEEQRVCVTLFYLQKESYTQISEKTGFSLLQVKSYIQNGKRNLKQMIEKKLKAIKAK